MQGEVSDAYHLYEIFAVLFQFCFLEDSLQEEFILG